MPTSTDYSRLAAQNKPLTQAEVKKALAPKTPVIQSVPKTPVITGATGSQLAAASAGGALSGQQAKQVIQSSQPKAPTSTGYTGVTGATGSQLAAASAHGALTGEQAKKIINPPAVPKDKVKDDNALLNPPAQTQTLGQQFDTYGQGGGTVDPAFAGGWNGGATTDLGTAAPGGGSLPRTNETKDAWWKPGGLSPDLTNPEQAATDRWTQMANDLYGQNKRDMTGNKDTPNIDANGQRPIPRTPEQLQVTDAARWTGQAIVNGKWPNIMTEAVANELYPTDVYASPGDWLADSGYYFDEKSGIWVRLDEGAPQITGAGGDYGGQVEDTGYNYDWGDYGWGGGYGGYPDYGGGSGYGNGGGGLVQWRISA